MPTNTSGDESRKNANHFDDGFGRRRVRRRRGSPSSPRSGPLTPPAIASTSATSQTKFRDALVQDPAIDTNAMASSSSDGGSMFHSATNFGIFGGNFLTVTVNANLSKDSSNPQSGSETKDDELYGESHLNEVNKKGKGKEKQVMSDEMTASDRDIKTRTTSIQYQSQSLRRSCDIYYQHIGVKRRGSPLWIPEPNKKLNISYQRKGNTIGDVGIITDSGGFDFLFNICLPLGHPINPSQLPENFVPFFVDPGDIREYSEFKGESYLSSASIKRSQHGGDTSGLNFEASASEGAILTMPVGLNSEDLGNIFWIRKYAAANAEHWYRYINQVRGREVKNGDVRLVIGYDKTTAWGIATFSNLTAQTDSFHLKFRPVEQSTVGRIYEWEHSGMAEVRSGPDAREIEALRMGDLEQQGAEYENQCLFVRTLNITLHNEIWKKLESELAELAVDDDPGYTSYSDSLPSSQPSPASTTTRPSQSMTSGGSQSQFQHLVNLPTALTGHPSDGINQMLLKLHPNSRIAVTEDKDWISVIREDDFVLPPVEEIYSRIMASFVVCVKEDMVFLEKIENHPKEPDRIFDMISDEDAVEDDPYSTPPSTEDFLDMSLFELSDFSSDYTLQPYQGIFDLPSFPATLGPSRYNHLYHSDTPHLSPSISMSPSFSPFSQLQTPMPSTMGDFGMQSVMSSPATMMDSAFQSFIPSPVMSDLSSFPVHDPQPPMVTTQHRLSSVSQKGSIIHIEQLQKFRNALSLPMEGAGPFIPQEMYIPYTNNDRKGHVEETMYEGPLYFVSENQQHGILVKDALHSRTEALCNSDQTVFEGRGPSVSIRIQWPGYREWSRQIPTRDFRSPPQPITLSKLAKNVAKCVQRFMLDHRSVAMENDTYRRWKIGDGPDDVKLEDLILVSLHHVSPGSWQPQLRLARPLRHDPSLPPVFDTLNESEPWTAETESVLDFQLFPS